MSEVAPQFKPEIPGKLRWRFSRLLVGNGLNHRYRITRHNSELVGTAGPQVSESNHRSNLDPPVLGWVMRDRRTPFYPAKDELDKFFLGWMLKGSGAMFFKRGDNDSRKAVYGEMGEKLDEGLHVHIFSEETRHNQGNRLGNTVSSSVSLAHEHGLDRILLAGIGGTETPRSKNIHVEFGEVALSGLNAVIELSQELRASGSRMTPYQASAILAQSENVPTLSLEELSAIINREEGSRHTDRRERKKLKDPESTQVTRMGLYSIFHEQVVRPKLQELVDIAYLETGRELAEPQLQLAA